jgi:hypothetical protein
MYKSIQQFYQPNMFQALQLIFQAREVLKRNFETGTCWSDKEAFGSLHLLYG